MEMDDVERLDTNEDIPPTCACVVVPGGKYADLPTSKVDALLAGSTYHFLAG